MSNKSLSIVAGDTATGSAGEISRNVLAEIDLEVKTYPVVLYMKGTLEQPMCGFSQRAALILQSYGQKIHAVNVLADEEVREGIKTYSQWPTIPQVYINGSFIGGSDIVLDLHESGKLSELLSAK